MDAVTAGMIGFFGGFTLIMVFLIYTRVVHLQRHVWLIARHLNIDLNKPPEVSDRVKELAADPARKIEAIKLLREETGAGLAEAKDAVEAYQRSIGR
jgi:ribosomal protein L7/L12